MAWTNIPNANLAAGAPIRSVDLIALRDNIPAVANGDSGAPKIQTNGINDLAVTTAKLATNEQMTTANVLARTAGASGGAVGTYALLAKTTGTTFYSIGSTLAGSSLSYAQYASMSSTVAGVTDYSGVPAGTWMCMGKATRTFTPDAPLTLWLRIS